MREHQFEYSLLVRAIYTALLWMSLFVYWIYPERFMSYLLLMLFFGLGLRPLLEKTGLVYTFQTIRHKLNNKRGKKHQEFEQRKSQKMVRDNQLRRSRIRDKRLPKNW